MVALPLWFEYMHTPARMATTSRKTKLQHRTWLRCRQRAQWRMTRLQLRLQRFAEPAKRLTDKRSGWRGGVVLLAALGGALGRAPVSVAQAVVPPNVQSAVRPSLLHEVCQDHAVLQRDRPIAVWGQAAGGEVVTLSLQPSLAGPAVSTVRAQADASGRWSAVLPPMGAGGPFVLAAQGSSGTRQSASDVLIGDVFLCSGQSNMANLPRHRSRARESGWQFRRKARRLRAFVIAGVIVRCARCSMVPGCRPDLSS